MNLIKTTAIALVLTLGLFQAGFSATQEQQDSGSLPLTRLRAKCEEVLNSRGAAPINKLVAIQNLVAQSGLNVDTSGLNLTVIRDRNATLLALFPQTLADNHAQSAVFPASSAARRYNPAAGGRLVLPGADGIWSSSSEPHSSVQPFSSVVWTPSSTQEEEVHTVSAHPSSQVTEQAVLRLQQEAEQATRVAAARQRALEAIQNAANIVDQGGDLTLEQAVEALSLIRRHAAPAQQPFVVEDDEDDSSGEASEDGGRDDHDLDEQAAPHQEPAQEPVIRRVEEQQPVRQEPAQEPVIVEEQQPVRQEPAQEHAQVEDFDGEESVGEESGDE